MAIDDKQPPNTCNGNLSKLPRPLIPLIERRQWAIWKWVPKPNGGWQKPPFMATQPDRHASTSNPKTWNDYGTALAAVHAGHGEGVTYMMTEDDPYGTIDIDNCRHPDTYSIDPWAQLFLEFARNSYSEVTPSGTGCRIWGLANGPSLNRKFNLNIDGKDIGVELFRRTPKALTITGLKLDTIPAFTNIDKVINWAIIWGERRKAAAMETAAQVNGFNDHDGNGCRYSVDQIEQIVRTGAPGGEDRSAVFHTIVGHYLGCSWTAEQIIAHLAQYPDGIAARYIHEDRLANEVWRSAGKYGVAEPVEAKAPPPKHDQPEPETDPELDDNADVNDADPELGDDEDAAKAEVGMAADALCAKVFSPLNFVVPGYIVEGLTLFAGKPKVGKSWLMLHAALATARNAFTLGDVYCAGGDVLYCALEDNKRRVQRRLNKLLNGEPAPKRLRILFAGEMPLLSMGGADLIRDWIEQVELPKLVVVDVLAKVRDRRQKDQGLYDADYAAMQSLKAIADEYGIAIVVIHHLRKMDADDPLDMISGTTGLTGSADSVLVLHRSASGTVLIGRGRDIEDIDKAVQFDRASCTWTVLGDAASIQLTGNRAAIIKALEEAGDTPLTPNQIAAACGLKAVSVRSLLIRMKTDGVVENAGYGKYALVRSTQTPK